MIRKPTSGADCRVFAFGLKNIAAACFFSGLIAGGICAITNPRTPQGAVAAANANAASNSVDRTAKSDRLRPVLGVAHLPTYRPVGCEPAFSPVADPVRARFFGRCIT